MIEVSYISPLISQAIIIGMLYALICTGLNVLYSTTRLLNIAHGEFIMIGAYVSYLCFILLGIPPLLSLFVAGALTGSMGLLTYKLLFQHFIRTSKTVATLEASSMLIFFAIIIIADSAAALMFKTDYRSYAYVAYPFSFGGFTAVFNNFLAMLLSIFAILSLFIFLTKTWEGRAITYVTYDEVAARIVGVNISKAHQYAIFIGTFLPGIAGSVISMMMYSIHPFIGLPFTMIGFVVLIIGGVGSLLGSLIGGLIFGFIETVGITLASAGYIAVVRYLAFIVVLLIRPKGLFGKR